MTHLPLQRMAASNSGPWGPMPGGKPSGSVPGTTAARPAPAVITLDDERRRYENVAQAQRAQDRFLNSLSHHRPNPITPPPPAAHGHMRPRLPPANSPGAGLKKPEAVGLGHLPPPPHERIHHVHPGHPGPPPPLTPIQSGYNKPPSTVSAGQPLGAGVSFKPYDFPRRDQVSPRAGQTYPNYPTAYSAPPISRSPQVPAQAQVVNVYSKPTNSSSDRHPTRPESLPASVNGPPPAHSSLPVSSRKIPHQYLPPPLASGGQVAAPSVRHPLPAPPPSHHHHTIANATTNDDQPLDLGLAPKRKLEEESNPEVGPTHKIFKSESSTVVKMETDNNGLLMRVSEPSALQSTESASSITTIPNAMHTAIKSEPTTKEANEESSSSSPQYVHKLKKAWIKAYNDQDSTSPASTPGTNRATPSPAPSNASSKSTKNNKKVNGHSKDESAADESSDSSTAKTGKSGKSGSSSTSGKRGGQGSTASARSTPRLKKTSESDSDNSKDSDATVSSRKSGKGRGRGRKPGKKAANPSQKSAPKKEVDDNNEEDMTSVKKEKENPFNNPPISVLKKTGDSFLQDADCFKVAPKLTKCRECKWSQHNKNAGSSTSIFCRYDSDKP